jgi:polysaccharide pyruvyl transferase WcaK-like protein
VKILVYSGSYALNNLGDVAMLQVAVSRLRASWPEADVHVLTSSPELLSRFCPGAIPVPSNGLRKWLEWSRLPGRARAPRAVSRRLARTDARFRDYLPALSDGLALRRGRNHRGAHADVEAFLGVVNAANLLVLGGGGYITDLFRGQARSSLELLSRFQRRQVPTAMLGQGIGPLSHPVLLSRAREVFPRVGVIGLREGLAALPYLTSIGVARKRIRVTGDDAIEPAFTARPERLGAFLGVNVRVSGYSNVGVGALDDVRRALRNAADAVGAALRSVPVSTAAGDSDVHSLRELLPDAVESDAPEKVDTPLALIHRVGECRVVVTGSYHGGVFALAEGIPVVGLTRSSYYTDKFRGLEDQFGAGCRVVSLDQPAIVDVLSATIRELWQEADERRPELLTAAARQIQESQAAYASLRSLVDARPSASATLSAPAGRVVDEPHS